MVYDIFGALAAGGIVVILPLVIAHHPDVESWLQKVSLDTVPRLKALLVSSVEVMSTMLPSVF